MEVKRVSNRGLIVKPEIKRLIYHQCICVMKEKDELDDVGEIVPKDEKVVIGAYFHGHVDEGNGVMRR